MSTDKHLMRDAFEKPEPQRVRVVPEGFRLGDTVCDELKGRVSDITLVRKLFRNRALICYSPDGIEARDGTVCNDCLHPQCRPQLKINLFCGRHLFLLDLSGLSAANLLALQDEADGEGVELVDWYLRLTVVNHDRWGEVRFERITTTIGKAS